MEKNKIVIHQAYYGEVDRAHSCIKQTIDDKELKSFLISFTDRPAALPPNIELKPYLSGSAFSKYYVFSKTFPDKTASRSGMVFSHVLIINIDAINSIIRIDDVLNNLVTSIPSDKKLLEEFELNIFTDSLTIEKFQPIYVQQSISKLLKGVSPILFSGDIYSFKIILQQLWNSKIEHFKRKIKFRTSFTPSDIVKINDLTIVSIQEEFLSRWTNKGVILNDGIETEIVNEAEKLFLGIKDDNLFINFLSELNVNWNDLTILIKSEEVYNAYINIDSIHDTDLFRIQLRNLSQISPNSNDGSKIKSKFLDKIDFFYTSGKDNNLKALRNVDLNSFENGELKIKGIISKFILSKIVFLEEKDIQILSDLLTLSNEEIAKTWWHQTILESFKNLLLKFDETIFENLWKMIDFSKLNFSHIFKLVDSDGKNEAYLRKSIPLKLKDSTIEDGIKITIKRKWYLLHADLILKHLNLKEALLSQLKFERELSFDDSFGVKYIAEKIDDIETIQITLTNEEEKLIFISAQRILKDKLLLNSIDVKNPIWVKIWSLVLAETHDISFGIEYIQRSVVIGVLDLIRQKIAVPKIIIELISKSDYADLSLYEDRINLWDKLPAEYLNNFIESTTIKIVENIILDQVEIIPVERVLMDKITSDLFMSDFLNKHKDEIGKVIKIYSSIPNLKDSFLANYIYYYAVSISEDEAIKLGNLVSIKKFKLSAKSVYDKSKYNSSFKIAFEICKYLVQIDVLESFFGIFKSDKNVEHSTPETIMKKKLPVVVVLTAIIEEYKAVRKHLINVDDFDNNDTSYEKGIFKLDGVEVAEVIIRECGAKNNIASQEAERAMSNFNPQMILFVGIAGSRKPTDFKIGDVIFPDKIYSYEGGKAAKDSFKARPEAEAPTYALIEKAKKERAKEDWKQLIKGTYENDPNANIGIIASGEQLIDHNNTEIGRILKEHYNDSSAVEMEGYGFIKAIKRQGVAYSNVICGVVRGISDIVEEDSNQDELRNDRRPENAKLFASDTASAFAFWLILKTFT